MEQPRNGQGQWISLREYFETRLDDIEEKLHDSKRSHSAIHVQEGLSRAEAASRIDARLELLNELRREVLDDRHQFVRKETYEATFQAMDLRIDGLHDQITEWKGRARGLSLSASIMVGLAGFASTVLALYFALN